MAELQTSFLIRLIDRATAPLRRITNNFEALSRAGKKASKAFELSANMKQSADAVESTSAKMVDAIKKPIKTFADFEETMSQARAVTFKGVMTADNKKQFDEMTAKARRLGAETKFSGSEAAAAMVELGTGGFTAKEQIDALAGTLDIAAAGNVSMADSASVSLVAIRGWKLEAKDAGRVGDVLVNTFTSANTNLSELSEAMKYVAPVAQSAGASLETTAAAVGELANVGIKGSQAGTTLRAMLTRIQAPGDKKAKSALRFLGINPKDKAGNMRPLEEILAQMSAAMDKKFGKGKGGTKRASLMKAIFGEEALAGSQALIDAAGKGSLQAGIKANMQAAGVAHRVALDMSNNTAGAVKEFESAMEEFQLVIAESVIPEVTKMIVGARDLVNEIAAWSKLHPTLTSGIVGTVGALGAAGLVISPMIKGVAALSSVWGGLMWVMGAARTAAVVTGVVAMKAAIVGFLTATAAAARAHPILAIVGLLITAGTLIYTNWEPLSEFFSGLWGGIKDTFDAVINWISDKITWAADKIAETIASAKEMVGLVKPKTRVIDAVLARAANIGAAANVAQTGELGGASGFLGALGQSAANVGEALGAPALGAAATSPAEDFRGELKITVEDGGVKKVEQRTRGDRRVKVNMSTGYQGAA